MTGYEAGLKLFEKSRLYLAVGVVTIVAPKVLPFPLNLDEFFGYTSALFGSFAGTAIGKHIQFTLTRILALAWLFVIVGVAYLAIFYGVATPSLFVIGMEAFLYVVCFACIFIAARWGDLGLQEP